ncbi:MAG TPA: hypothetical protein VE870_11400 [Bacteroidales bacterium]|nr:hypothetical protein [Bacteroidales bacterium]
MKRILTIISLCLLTVHVFSQHMPVGINYQAVARDNLGNELKNRNLNIRLSVIAGDPTGTVEYAETHTVTTDNFGLFNLVIGSGSYYQGGEKDFTAIDWASSSHFLKVEVDFGQGFISMGTMQFLAVPYALYAATAGNTAGEKDLDKDPENELQVLSLEGQILRISKGNAITLSDVVNDADADPGNELQDLQIDQKNKLKITKNPSASIIDLNPFLDNTDNQTLTKTPHSIAITGGNEIFIDTDSTNELQTLSSEVGKLTLSKNGGTVDIEDADADPENEIQDLNLNGYDLSITSGKTVNIRPDIIAFRSLRSNGTLLNAGDTVLLTFEELKLNMGESFNTSDGKFKVPSGGEGLYSFSITYDYSSNQSLMIFKNSTKYETLLKDFSSPSGARTSEFLMDLNEGDQVQLFISSSTASIIGAAIFSGYRLH